MTAEEVVAAYATKLFIRSEAEARRPVVLLSGERTNVYGVLEKHFKETALPPSERFWRTVRTQWSPMLETWRPRVNGVQLKVLSGARLPESEEEWSALRSALSTLRPHLRPDSSVDLLHAELRDFVAMVVSWWENRKKSENGGTNGTTLLKRVASAGLMLGGAGSLGMSMGLPPPPKKPCLEFLQLGPPQHPPGPSGGIYHQTMYAAPEIMPGPLLTGPDGSSCLVVLPPQAVAGRVDELQGKDEHRTQHGGGGYLQQLNAGPTDSQLFDQLFQPPVGPAMGGSDGQSPRDQGQAGAPEGAVGAAGGFAPQSPLAPQEGSADNQGPRQASATLDGKRFVTLNVGGHRFMTTTATLAAVEGSYFWKLAHQASGRGATEFFVDRSGKIFEYVLDYLRSRRFSDSPSTLPKDERTLHMLARESEFYQLPELAERARAALATDSAAAIAAAAAAAALAPGNAGESTPSDAPANIIAAANEGSAHGSRLLLGRFGSGFMPGAPGGQLQGLAAAQQQQAALQAAAGPAVLDAVFVETGFVAASALGGAQAGLLEQLNATVAAKQRDGFAVVDFQCGTERDGSLRSVHYHVLLRKPGSVAA